MERFYLPYEEALELILSQPFTLPSEKVYLPLALGRVLREDVRSDVASPPVPLSAMDGYAVNSSFLPGVLKVVGEIPAGSLPDLKPSPGEAVRLFTGSPLPPGCDAVIPVEDVEVEGERIVVKKPCPSGSNVRPPGEDFTEGSLLLKSGEVVGPVELGLLSAAGRTAVEVSVRPRVGIIATGSEVIEPFEGAPLPFQVRNTNAYMLVGLVSEAGGEPVYFGLVDDTRKAVMEAVERALSICDLVITSGGVSAGDYDFVRDVLPELGVETVFYKCRVKPGKPVLFGKREGKFVFALPGFPVSTVVSFYSFVYPFLRKGLGARELFKRRVRAVLEKPFRRKKAGRLEFVRCSYAYDLERGVYRAFPLERQGSGVISSLRGKVALMPVPEGIFSISSGKEVELILIKEA